MNPRAVYRFHRQGYQMEAALGQFCRNGWSLSRF